MTVQADSRGAVSHIQTFCLHDGEGIRTTVFLAGCPLRCRWCANPETWDAGQAGTMSVGEVVARCCRDRIFYRQSGGGVTISGGEPGMQPDFLVNLLGALANEGLDTALETSGCFTWDRMAEAIRRVDFLFIDLKHMDAHTHARLTGHDNRLILENTRKTGALGKDMVIRLPLVPGVNDQEENLAATAEFVIQYVPGRRIELLPYHDWARHKYAALGLTWTEYPSPSASDLDKARSILAGIGVTVVDFK